MIVNFHSGRTAQGGSTVTQQLVRNTFDLKGHTLRRKLLETFLAMRIEKTFSKEKIMELYLNRVYCWQQLLRGGGSCKWLFWKTY
jgi:membrane peptidoglycan carboxypeptidase